MKYFLLTILIIFELGSLSAQSFVGKLNPFPLANVYNSSAVDTIKILAVMVEFQQDADGTTSGNGKFGSIYTQNYGNDILDPLPHDQTYFETHLEFVKNYFAKVSKGQLTIQYTVLPDTFSVSDRMRNYSPPPGSDNFTPIADFSVEAWTLANQIYSGFNFSDYDVFLIFHAGVGRDVSLPGSIGNERDLPSIYLSYPAFKEIYGESYEGIPVSNGSFNITNTVIIPETESRELETLTGTILFQLTINGLIAASIGSHLGLPDLFDTETGLSVIGRFGLMDGQSIFAYLGTYPPEPSPWSKIKLGWAEAVTLDIQNADVSIVTDVVATISDTVILKVPLNSTEYYLIENRQRDANKDGSIVTYVNNGSVLIKTFPKDTTGYYSFSVDSLSGVIIDVDEFDWAVPGNGILIWHIDENVINEKIADNEVNTDKNRRGVDVEEADGVQDIGERFFTIFGDEVIGEGAQEDFWYASNPAPLFQNLFDKDTRPDTRTNTGANSLITMKDFSEIDNTMSFRVEFGDSVIKPLFVIQVPNQQGGIFNLSTINFNDNVLISTLDGNGSLKVFDEDSLYYESSYFSKDKQTSVSKNNTLHFYGGYNTSLNFWITDNQNSYQGTVEVPSKISTPLVINEQENLEPQIWLGAENGRIYKYSMASFPSDDPIVTDSITLNQNVIPIQLSVSGNYYALISGPAIGQNPENLELFSSSLGNLSLNGDVPVWLATTIDSEGDYVSVVKTGQNNYYIIKNGKLNNQFFSNSTSPSFSLTDLKKDGNIYILENDSRQINAFNFNGSLADNFPSETESLYGLAYTPISSDIEGDNNAEVISISWNGNIYSVDGGTGRMITGFPISTGDVSVTPSLFIENGKVNIIARGRDGLLFAWSISSVEEKLYWSEEFGNPQNTSFVDAAENTNRVNEFFPSNKAYNYPNPVYEGTTNIRYYVSENASINIKIFDLAGDYVAELNDEAQGGMDNETVWDVSNIQSGIYFARIEASSNNGQSEQAIIKIAVVK